MIDKRAAAALRVLLALAICSPLTSQQDEERPYFSLSSGVTFASGAEPFVQLSGYGIDAVKVRVYRVNDPVQFMRQMADPHQFGGSHPIPQGKRTLLERIHQWKRDFTEAPSAHFQKSDTAPAKSGNRATYYAEAPVLNQQQLVLSFLQSLTAKENRWDSQKVNVPVHEKGVFLVEAVHDQLSAYTVLVVSDLVLMTKTGRDHILYYVADRKTGEPVTDATVTAMARDDKGTSLKLGADGVAEYKLNETPAADLRVVATRGKDAAFATLDTWAFSGRERNLSGVVYTDRPVYRPGDTTHFRAVLRFQQATGYSLAAERKFSVQVMDHDGKAVYQKELTSNKHGVIHDELPLAKDAGLGSYAIEVRIGESTASGSFEVQEYKKPEYEVHVTPATRRILQGQKTQVTIDSKYYFGEPVAGATVKYSIFRSRYWFPLWYEPDEEGESGDNEPNDYGNNEEAKQGEGKLDADGKLVITVPTEVAGDKSDTLYRVEAGVTDQAGREISGTGWVIASYGEFLLNVQPDRWFYQPGSKGSFKIQARDYENKPVSTPVHLEIRQYDWRARSLGQRLAQGDVRTGSDGVGTVDLPLPATGGDYRVIATSPSAGRIVETYSYVWVTGYSSVWGSGETAKSIQIIPDKKTYSPGDTAQIMIATGEDKTPVLVTVEGRDVRSHTLIRAKGGTAVFSYKVGANDEPAFFVSTQFFRDGELHQNTKRIKVPPADHKLDIKLSTDKPQYLPGQPANYSIDVKTADGKPAAETELSLGVVDEAIYAIARDSTPDLVDVFYGREYNSVRTEDSLSYYFSGEAGTRRMQLAALRPRTRLAQLKPEQLVKPKVRKYFPDTTFWAADITTDANGHAKAQFQFPDSLTTWRATARGSSLDDRYGSTVAKTIVRKNLILRLAVPRFFVQGDEVVISAIVHNYLQSNKQAKVSVKLEGLDLIGGAQTQDVTVPQKGEAKVDWRVKARTLRKAKITAEGFGHAALLRLLSSDGRGRIAGSIDSALAIGSW
jgi:uncharacterized protein YfaS (alpha-2-macroglobulin family)